MNELMSGRILYGRGINDQYDNNWILIEIFPNCCDCGREQNKRRINRKIVNNWEIACGHQNTHRNNTKKHMVRLILHFFNRALHIGVAPIIIIRYQVGILIKAN